MGLQRPAAAALRGRKPLPLPQGEDRDPQGRHPARPDALRHPDKGSRRKARQGVRHRGRGGRDLQPERRRSQRSDRQDERRRRRRGDQDGAGRIDCDHGEEHQAARPRQAGLDGEPRRWRHLPAGGRDSGRPFPVRGAGRASARGDPCRSGPRRRRELPEDCAREAGRPRSQCARPSLGIDDADCPRRRAREIDGRHGDPRRHRERSPATRAPSRPSTSRPSSTSASPRTRS